MVTIKKVDTRFVVFDDKGNRIFRTKSEEEANRFVERLELVSPVDNKGDKVIKSVKKLFKRKKKVSDEESSE